MRPEELDQPGVAETREATSAFVTEHIRENALTWEREASFPERLLPRLAENGLVGLSLPEEHEGHGKSLWHEVAMVEELATCHALGWALSVMAHTNMVAPLLHQLGSEEQLDSALAPALCGEHYLALGATEAGSGSDLTAVSTRVEDGRLHGEKYYITNGSVARYVLVLARLGYRENLWSLGFVLVDTEAEGVTTEEIETSGLKSGDTGALRFDGYEIDERSVVGEPGNAFFQLLEGMKRERLLGAAGLNSLSLHVLDKTVSFLQDRERYGESLSEKQVIRHRIATLRSRVEAARQLTYRTLQEFVSNGNVDNEALMVKIHAYETAQDVIDYCTHIHGAQAFSETHWLAHLSQDSRAFTLAAGSAEVLRDMLAQQMQL